MRAISIQALWAVIDRHKLKPVDGEYHFTDEMAAEAAAIDEANGAGMSPSRFEDLKATLEGKQNSGNWEIKIDCYDDGPHNR